MLPESLAKYVVRFRPGAMVVCAQRDGFAVRALLAEPAVADMRSFG